MPVKALQTRLARLYAELLVENGVDLSQGSSAEDGLFFDDAINARVAIDNHGATFFIQLKTFEHIQSTGRKLPGCLVAHWFAMCFYGWRYCSCEPGGFILPVISSVAGCHRFVCHTVRIFRGEQVFVGAVLLR